MKALMKILLGAVGIGVIVKFTPILDILYLFFMIVCIPVILLYSIGLISDGTYEAFAGQGNNLFQTLRDRVDAHRNSPEVQAECES